MTAVLRADLGSKSFDNGILAWAKLRGRMSPAKHGLSSHTATHKHSFISCLSHCLISSSPLCFLFPLFSSSFLFTPSLPPSPILTSLPSFISSLLFSLGHSLLSVPVLASHLPQLQPSAVTRHFLTARAPDSAKLFPCVAPLLPW